ncbi:cupin domain-containing protein [Dongia sp.]|uniref:cupin domain-containing protein n=1 Tax=Dongia sp. TaxID=1977262 RepID=UPI0035B1D99B
MTKNRAIRFALNGQQHEGLSTWPAIPADEIDSGSPVQRGLEYFNDPRIGLSTGVWDCTAFTGKMGPYPVNEFMIVLEGGVTMMGQDGGVTHVAAGESFIIPKGTVCQWRQDGYLKKYYVIFDDASGADPARASAQRVLKIDTLAPREPTPSPAAELLIGSSPRQSGRNWFEDASKQWTVGVWDSTPYRRKAIPFPRHELMHLLEGSVTLSDPDGWSETYHAGETFFVPMGANVEWLSTEYVKKYYCIMIPKG